MDAIQPKKSRTGLIIVLVVVGVFIVFVIPIVLLIAIPTMGNMTRFANETSAMQSIRAINLAEAQYSATYPQNGFACSLAALGGDPHAGQPSPQAAQLLQSDLASGVKAGYQFFIANCARTTMNGTEYISSYTVLAQPLNAGKTGKRSFCSDQSGEIKFDPTGGTNCTQSLTQ